MTQIELPQLSLQRYVDLVRRRRWQVVPVSILGLIIGGLIAFFIPRMFVAETLLVHAQLPTGAEDAENPFKQIVDTAKSAIPLYVEDAVRDLNWPEFNALDEFERGQFARDVESRISVIDRNGGDSKRAYALLRVQYRDQDGQRSAELLNKLVQVWMARRTLELREPARQASSDATARAGRALKTLQQCRSDKQILEQQYGIDPSSSLDDQRLEYAKKLGQQKEDEMRLAGKQSQMQQLQARLASDEEALAELAPRVEPVDALWFEAAMKDPKIAPLAVGAAKTMLSFTNTYKPGTRLWYKAKRDYGQQVAFIKTLLPKVVVDDEGLVPNPEHAVLKLKILDLIKEAKVLAAEIDLLNSKADADLKRLRRLQEGYRFYDDKLRQIDEAQTARNLAVDDEVKARRIDAALTQDLPVKQVRKAVVPPVPTEPNIMLVATGGSLFGLLVAIGLILLFDFLQGSFKTEDDVERALGVPMLGGVSYLETDSEREHAVRSRRRISLVTAAALLMVTAIVVIFYLDPNRLPIVVRDVLSVLLIDE